MLKYKIILLSFLITCFVFGNVSYANENNNLELFGKVIYIDPGHGGIDPGAMYKNIKEKDINLKISKVLEKLLTEEGAIVYLTRYDDYDLAVPNTINRKRSDLSRRGNIINRSGCDLYLSIHLNSDVSSKWQGAQVFYNNKNEKNFLLAQSIQTEFKQKLYSKRKIKQDNEYYLHKRTIYPGVLIEAGFLSNPNDRYKLMQEEYQIKLSRSIIDGIKNYFNNL